MFHKKFFSAAFAVAVFFSLTCQKVFAASGNITSLKLDFLRTEELLENGQSSSMTGTVIYNKNPFVFVFKIKTPVEQTMYLNDENAFIIEGTTIYEVSDNKDFLEQTCIDFLNWFKSDYGLEEASFKPTDRWIEDGAVVSQWDSFNTKDQPLDKIIVYSDSCGRFTRLTMFANAQDPVTDTSLYSFESKQGYCYPTSIVSISYDGAQAFLKTQLGFSKVQFVLGAEELSQIQNMITYNYENLTEYQKIDLSDLYEIHTPVATQAASYKTSIPSVLVGASFSFYKTFITSQDMSNCPFYPTCSQYMLEAVQANGIFGFFQGLERLKRCTTTEHKRDQYPTLSNGKHYDPVPVKTKK